MCLEVLRKLGKDIEHALINAATINAATDYELTEEFGTCIRCCRAPTSHKPSVPAISFRKSEQPEGVELFKLMAKGSLKQV